MSYLNTWPLVWGFLYGPGRGRFDFRFDLPAQCADALQTGQADVGLVPCAELDRLDLDFLPHLGIASEGPVRSILLISKRPFPEIRTLAADSSSRTSVALTRILLAEKYGCSPVITPQAPNLEAMLSESDAALIIGDPALRLDARELPWPSLDLGDAWTSWTGLPMVFAVWAGKKQFLTPEVSDAFRASYEWGASHTEEIVAHAARDRAFPEPLTREYLTRNIVYPLGPKHLQGLQLFRAKVAQLQR